jgi:hypothetical protein
LHEFAFKKRDRDSDRQTNYFCVNTCSGISRQWHVSKRNTNGIIANDYK